MSQQSVIVDTSGRPLSMPAPRRARADGSLGPDGTTTLSGTPGALFPYDASNWQTQEMGNWFPIIRSPDAEINWFRDRIVARSRDLVRNSGWAAGGITRILDNMVGTHLRLSATPDYRALAIRFGIAAFDAKWADEFRRAAEALWRTYTESPGRWCDVTRQLTMGQQFRLAARHKLIDGESLILAYWMDDRMGYGGADYATSFLLVDPDRLSNPYQKMDSKHLRGGVELDADGLVPVAYHIRSAEQNDWYNALEANTWERVPREDDDGWRRVIHDFDPDRAGQHRGLGVFTPVLGHMKMLAKYYGVELQAATIAATFGTYVKSPYDPALVQDALGGEDSELTHYQQLRSEWAKERPAMFDGARIPTLAPGEDIVGLSSEHPHSNFGAFAHEMLCVFASATGVSVEQVTQDWSKTNYASARAALMETWKTLMRRRHQFTTNTATPMYGAWLQEAMERGELPLPAGAPTYMEAAAAYSRSKWLGPARGWVDPTKEPQGTILRLESGTSTLEDESSEQGRDWEEILQQRAIEKAAYEAAGVPLPAWANVAGSDAFAADDEKIEKADA
jgi:lambda family phage portal protein